MTLVVLDIESCTAVLGLPLSFNAHKRITSRALQTRLVGAHYGLNKEKAAWIRRTSFASFQSFPRHGMVTLRPNMEDECIMPAQSH